MRTFIKTAALLVFLFMPLASIAQRFSVEDLINIRALDIADASSYFDQKGWKLFKTSKNESQGATEVWWSHDRGTTGSVMMLRYILPNAHPEKAAVTLSFSGKSNFEAMKKQAKNRGMQLQDSGVDDYGHIFSTYQDENFRLRFSTSSLNGGVIYEAFILRNDNLIHMQNEKAEK